MKYDFPQKWHILAPNKLNFRLFEKFDYPEYHITQKCYKELGIKSYHFATSNSFTHLTKPEIWNSS